MWLEWGIVLICVVGCVCAAVGAAYGTAKAGIGISGMGTLRPELIMKVSRTRLSLCAAQRCARDSLHPRECPPGSGPSLTPPHLPILVRVVSDPCGDGWYHRRVWFGGVSVDRWSARAGSAVFAIRRVHPSRSWIVHRLDRTRGWVRHRNRRRCRKSTNTLAVPSLIRAAAEPRQGRAALGGTAVARHCMRPCDGQVLILVLIGLPAVRASIHVPVSYLRHHGLDARKFESRLLGRSPVAG